MRKLLLLLIVALWYGCKKEEEKTPAASGPPTPTGLYTYTQLYTGGASGLNPPTTASWRKINGTPTPVNFTLGSTWTPAYPSDYVDQINFAIGDTITWATYLTNPGMVGWALTAPSYGNYFGVVTIHTDSVSGIPHKAYVGATNFTLIY